MATTKKFRVKHGLDASNNTISFVNDPVSANDAATKNYVDIQVASAPGDVSNTYLTSTFTTNTDFQSFVANTNPRFAQYLEVANVSFAIQSDIDNAIANLVSSAPSTLDTLNELANALANDANFSTTVTTNLSQKLGATASVTLTGDVTGSGSFSSNAVSIALTDTNLANTNAYIASVSDAQSQYLQVANVASNTSTSSATFTSGNSTITFTRDDSSTYDVNLSTFATANTSTSSATYTVANATLTFTRADSSTFDVVIDSASVEVSNTAPSGANEGDMWWDNASGELYIYYSNNWVEAVAQDVTPYANNGTFSASNNTITFVRTDGSQFDVVLTGVGEVTNAYVTSTFTTNTDFQAFVANTNSYIATVSGNQSQYLQVANSTTFLEQSDVDQYLQVANVSSYGFATESYVDTSVAALVNAAPTTLNTLDELASALGDDANFATTTTNLIGTKASNTYVNTLLANTNAYIATKANTSMLSAYLEVANVESSSSVTVSNSAPTITANGDLWWDNASGELYIAYANNWVEAVAQDVTPYTNNASYTTGNTTLTFVRTDGSQYEVSLDLSGVSGEVSNSYLTSTFTTNAVFQSALANTNAYIATKTDDSTVLATNTALRTLIDDRLQVANATATFATQAQLTSTNTAIRSYVDTEISALVNSAPTTLDTLEELATALGDDANFSTTVLTLIGTKASNATLTSTYVTNTVFQSALANTNSYIDTKANTGMLSAYLEVANASSGAAVTVSNTTPSITANGDLWWDNSDGELYIAYGNNWVEAVAQDVTPYTNNASYTSGNTTLTFVRTDGSQYEVYLDLSGVSGEVSNSYLTSNYVTNTVFQSALANTNLAISDRMQVANVIAYTAKYLEVANSSSGGASITVSNTAPSITSNGELWWDNADGELYISYSNNWIEAVARDVSPYTSNVVYSTSNNTLTFVRTDATEYSVTLDLSGVQGEVSNSYLTSTFVTNTDFQSALANTNSYIATKTDDSTVLATNTALRTLISDRIQVANAETRFLRKDGTASQSVGGQVTFSDNVIISGNLIVSGTRTEVNTEQLNVSNTYILLNSDLSSGTAATENAGLIVNRGSEANVYFRWNETEEYWEYGEADGTFTSITEASATIINARNESGSQIDQGAPVYVSGYSGGGARPLVELADADDQSKMSAIGLALETVTTGNNIRIASYGVFENANTGVFTEGQELYVDTTAGKLTGTRPLGDSTKIQKIGKVLRSHATAGTILIQGAGRSNDIPNLPNLNVFIGNTSGVGTTRQLQYSDLSDVGYVTANTISIKNPANYHEYAITVDTKTSAHPYSGGSSSAYFLDGVESPSIVLAPNQTYRFDQSDSTNSSHPLDFYVDADKNTAYTTGVTVSGTAGSAGAYTEIVVDEDTPQVLYYQCQNHSYMGSVASILSDTSPKYLEVANSTSFITSTALSPYLEVANVATELADYWPSANIIAYTAKYLEVANNTGSSAANTSTTSATLSGTTATFTRADSSIFTLDLSSLSTGGTGGGNTSVAISNSTPTGLDEGDFWFDENVAELYILYSNNFVQVSGAGGSSSNTSTTSATLSGNTATFTRADSSTFDLDLSGLSTGGGGGASVTVANTAPVSPTEGDLYFDNELATMFIYYDSSWVEVQPSVNINPLTYGIDTFTANGTATDFTHTSDTVSADAMLVTVDGVVQRPTTDYTVSNKVVTFGTAPSDTSIVAIRVTTGAYVDNSNNSYGITYAEATANTTATAGNKYIVDTTSSAITITLPVSATLGDEVGVMDGTGNANTNNITVDRNGHNIQGSADNLVVDVNRGAFTLVYYNTTQGWLLTEV